MIGKYIKKTFQKDKMPFLLAPIEGKILFFRGWLFDFAQNKRWQKKDWNESGTAF